MPFTPDLDRLTKLRDAHPDHGGDIKAFQKLTAEKPKLTAEQFADAIFGRQCPRCGKRSPTIEPDDKQCSTCDWKDEWEADVEARRMSPCAYCKCERTRAPAGYEYLDERYSGEYCSFICRERAEMGMPRSCKLNPIWAVKCDGCGKWKSRRKWSLRQQYCDRKCAAKAAAKRRKKKAIA